MRCNNKADLYRLSTTYLIACYLYAYLSLPFPTENSLHVCGRPWDPKIILSLWISVQKLRHPANTQGLTSWITLLSTANMTASYKRTSSLHCQPPSELTLCLCATHIPHLHWRKCVGLLVCSVCVHVCVSMFSVCVCVWWSAVLDFASVRS